jgi:aminopeptidase N
MKGLLLPIFLLILETVHGFDPYPKNESIDIRHYLFRLELNDSTNRIGGEATIDIRFKKGLADFELDLAGLNSSGQGMQVSEVTVDGKKENFSHAQNRLKISLSTAAVAGDEKRFVVTYSGIPQDGLIIGKNKYGDRTFFGDNWPDRAHHWLPTIDHPYDKATCEFIVSAPEQYSVIATGERVEESAVAKRRKITHWKTSVLLPTKVMVIGVARFAIGYEGEVNKVPMQSWVYPQNRHEGFSDYAMAAGPLDFFSKNIAPYPYEKLANVQSTTRWGGMENAGNIFYYENSVTGKGNIESLLAHEIAHQWFGDSASEADWYHVWLSEGFATYFTHLYLENKYGMMRLASEMENDRQEVIKYFKKDPTPIVNAAQQDIGKVLNTNTYQKASWVLHMLRHEVGDQKFWEAVREYYSRYQLGNALTDDFRKVVEGRSDRDLKSFFDQWIFKAGHPVLGVTWKFDQKEKKVRLTVEQKQAVMFDFPLEIAIGQGGKQTIEKFRISAKKQEFAFASSQKPTSILIDPNVWLLFEGNAVEALK